MKRITALLLALTVTGCASTHTFQASPQFYRAKGQDDQIQITGKIVQDIKQGAFTATIKNHVTIFFNGQPQIDGFLDGSQSGELSGQPFEGKNTSASCSAKAVTKDWSELKCIVFIDNERAATLIM